LKGLWLTEVVQFASLSRQLAAGPFILKAHFYAIFTIQDSGVRQLQVAYGKQIILRNTVSWS
jgi:hypothetical protein